MLITGAKNEARAPTAPEFGEQVRERRPKALAQAGLEPRWDRGAYLGTRWGSVEHYMAAEDGTSNLLPFTIEHKLLPGQTNLT